MQQPDLKIIISGGGTGGHIFPAVAIAQMLQKKQAGVKILFVGALGKMEMEKVPAAGFEIVGLPVSGFQRSLSLKNIAFPFKLAYSLYQARSIIKKFKPAVAIGTGGYASGPTLRMAAAEGIPCLLQEQNSFPGITNKLLAAKAQKICVAYDHMEEYFPPEKIVLTGNPVRQDILKADSSKQKALEFFDLRADKPVILIVGGSQGARGINNGISAGLDKFVDKNIQLLWQCGRYSYEEIKKRYGEYETKGIRITEFISRMDLAYAAADLVISRAGAIAISELSIAGKACIFVPLPTAAANHQHKNAMALVEKNAAILVSNKDATEILADAATDLIKDHQKLNELRSNIKKLAKPNATEEIANEVLKLANIKK